MVYTSRILIPIAFECVECGLLQKLNQVVYNYLQQAIQSETGCKKIILNYFLPTSAPLMCLNNLKLIIFLKGGS